MALTANVYLEINNTTKKGRIVDASNYTEEGIVLAQLSAKGLGNVYSPTGAVIVNGSTVGSPLVNLASSTTGAWFDLPLDSTGEILNGTYSFTYSLRYAITAGTVDSVATTSTFVLEFTNAGRVLIAGDSLVTTGNTQTANNGTFTVSTAAFNTGSDNSTIVVTQTTLVNEGSATGTYSFDVTRANFAGDSYTWNGCNMVTLDVTTTYDCDSTQYGQLIVQDTTDYNGQELTSRVISVWYPNGLNPAPTTDPETTTLSSLTINSLATGTWTYSLVSNITVTQADGLVYTYSETKTAEFLVSCAGTLCGLTPCIASIYDKYQASYVLGQDSGLAPLILNVLQLVTLAKEYKFCGDATNYAATVLQLETILDESGYCNCGCCTETDTPQWINNAGFSAQTVLQDLYDQVQTLTYGETTLFLGNQFYGADDSFDNVPLAFTTLDGITIPSTYIDFPTTDLAFGKKAIEFNLKGQTVSSGGEMYLKLTNGSGTTILAQGFGATDEAVTVEVKVVLRVQKSGTDYLLWTLITQNFFNITLGTVDTSAINATYTNVLTSGEDLVFNLQPTAVGAAAKTTYTHVKISALKSLI